MIKNPYLLWLVSAIFSIAYLSVPWAELQGFEFEDLFNYISRIKYLHENGREQTYQGIGWFFSEPLWKEITILFGNLFAPENYRLSLYITSFVALLITTVFLLKRVTPFIGLLLMVNPMSIDLYLSQLRNALEFGLLLLSYDLASRNWRIVTIISAFFIHASTPLFLSIYYLLYKLNLFVESKKYYLITIVTALGLVLFMKYGIDIILSLLGDRHAGYENVIAGSSISYSIVWFFIALIIATFANFENTEQRIIAGFSITMMSFFFFASLLGLFAQRYVALSIPLIIISIGYLPKHYKQGTYLLMFAYTLLQFKYWLSH